VGVYLFLLLLVVLLLGRSSTTIAWWAPWVISIFLALSLARYLSTNYRIDELYLRARRILGGAKVRLDQIRRIEYVSLRDLSPTAGIIGSWGWRGRMWSPIIGRFDALHTDAAHGLLVTAGDVPMYISPKDSVEFARELSRRVRSYSGKLPIDVGDPAPERSPAQG
jgi:Bacterial PH domain